jgi:uncharacterized membrane protein HdeD (DUF308 family)
MKNILGIILIIAGIAVFIQGLNRKDSLAGRAAEAGASIANSVDGGARQPKHVVYMVVGGILVLVGAGVMARRGPTTVTNR